MEFCLWLNLPMSNFSTWTSFQELIKSSYFTLVSVYLCNSMVMHFILTSLYLFRGFCSKWGTSVGGHTTETNAHPSLLKVLHMFFQIICYAAPYKLGTLFFQQIFWDSFNLPSPFHFIFPNISLPYIFYMLQEGKRGNSEWGSSCLLFWKPKKLLLGKNKSKKRGVSKWLTLLL